VVTPPYFSYTVEIVAFKSSFERDGIRNDVTEEGRVFQMTGNK